VRDTAQKGTVFLYEPAPRPARGARSADLDSTGHATLVVEADDIVPGVHEIVLQAMPGADWVYDLEAAVPPVRVSAADSGVVVTPAGVPGVGVRLEELGIVLDTSVTIAAGATVRAATPAPAWARRFVLEVEVAPETWNRLTDLALTVYDSTGAQLANGPMNYPYHRVEAALPEGRADGFGVTWELFPGFANPVPPARVDARVRLRFEGDTASAVTATPAGDRLVLPVPRSRLPAPEGWRPLHRLVIYAPGDTAMVTQLLPARPRGAAR
jgi:hypothetical protein